jgi:hypothetical protein
MPDRIDHCGGMLTMRDQGNVVSPLDSPMNAVRRKGGEFRLQFGMAW